MAALAQTSNLYRGLGDEALHRELEALQRKCAALRFSSTATGNVLLAEFRERLDQARAEQQRRRNA